MRVSESGGGDKGVQGLKDCRGFLDLEEEEIIFQIQSPFRIWRVRRSPTEYSKGYEDSEDEEEEDSEWEEGDLLEGSIDKMAPSARTKFRRPQRIILVVVVLVALACIAIAVSVHVTTKKAGAGLFPPDPEVPLPPSPSVERRFRRGAVCSDGRPCSDVGRDILARNGSAVDAAVAAMLCNGVVNCQSMGLGGGFFMVAYNRAKMESFTLDARETAPAATSTKLYEGNPNASRKGPLAVAVPGELKGYWEAHKRFGRLPWAEVVRPAIEICESGYNMTKHQADSLKMDEDNIRLDPTLREVFVDAETGEFLREGSLIRNVKICKTLRIIAEKGGDELYSGQLAQELVKDIRDIGGIITLQDLKNYRARWSKPVEVNLHGNLVLHTSPLPSSGPLLAFILSTLDAFEFGPESVANESSTITTYHRIIEVFKHAFAMRGKLGDPYFADVGEVMRNLTARDFAEWVREQIRDDSTSNDPAHYGVTSISPDDHGTAHISVIAPDGDAVSLTSSINLYFGAGYTSPSTGIILNSCMDDFSHPGFENYFGIPPSEANSILPNKRALSSMAPAIIIQGYKIDEDGLQMEGSVRLVIGASGGTKIPTAVSLVAWRHLWLKESIKKAVDASRFHHQLYPMEISYEYGILKQVLKGLQKLGHKTSRYRDRGSVVCAIAKQGVYLYANADYRKGGDVFGLD